MSRVTPLLLSLLTVSLSSAGLLPAPGSWSGAGLAGAQTWSMAASTCVPDSASLPLYDTDGQSVAFRPGVTSPSDRFGVRIPLILRCPVLWPEDTPPPWDTLTVRYFVPSGSRLRVRLLRASATRSLELLAEGAGQCTSANELLDLPVPPTWDFAGYTYVVELALWRTSPRLGQPRVYQVRLRARQPWEE